LFEVGNLIKGQAIFKIPRAGGCDGENAEGGPETFHLTVPQNESNTCFPNMFGKPWEQL
jgi:hypothetical protein